MSSLSQLIRERDMKRETLSNLFEEKKRIMDQMKTMNEDLLQLDDDIEALEEAHERKQANQRQQQVQPNSNLSAAHRRQISPPSQVKSEPITTISDSNSSSSVVPLTMNPDEVLSEPDQPTQTTPQRQQFEDDEQLTDPLTWMTQAAEGERRTEQAPASTSAVEQQQQRRRQLHQEPPAAADYHDDDYYYDEDDNDNDEDGSRINNNNNNITDSNNSKNINTSAKLPPLQFESVDGPKPAASMQRTKPTGTLDSFIVRNTSTPAASSSSSSSSAINCPYSQHDIQQTLSQSFRLQNFRENQLEIIQSTLSGKDCFVLMKTGGGKSLLYQLPAILEFPKITLVVSPLLSLIQDQEDQMNGFVRNSCVSFSSGMSVTEQNENWNKIRDVNSGVMMILVTPERVFKSNKLKSELQKLEEQNRLGRFVIDECHCACQWGHDFRPDYAKLQVLRQHFPQVPILAVTATASEQVRKESAQIFQLSRNHAFFRSTADRPNLTYQVRPKDSNVIQDMTDFIKEKHPRSAGIVYTYSKKDADTVARELGLQGIVASAYHSDVTPVRKKAIHQSWMKNRTQVVVATIAFGLGINKPDVRFVFHHTLSKTLESYYQESGRAGRDGKQADCVLFYTPKDVPRMLKMIAPDVTLFMTMVRYAQQFGDDRACRALILQHMGEPNQNTGSFIGVSDGVEIRDVTSHAITLVCVLMHLQTKNVTLNMLNEEWRKKPTNALQCVKNNPPNTDLTKEDCERVIIGLLVNGFSKFSSSF
jgi:ATP-dependent DNA helicase Q1